jgi:hypothetical protein
MKTGVRRTTTLEATHGKTRSRGLDSGAVHGDRRERSVRFFRDQHGTEFLWNSHTVPVRIVEHGHHTSGDHDVFRRHWTVVCADRGDPAGR